MSELLALLASATPQPGASSFWGPLAFMGFGFQEILLVGFVALLVFGGNLPDVMRQLGRTYGRLRSSLNELSAPVRDEMRQLRDVPAPLRRPTSYDTPSEDLADIPPLEEDGDAEDIVPEDSVLEDSVPQITTTPGFQHPSETPPPGGLPPEEAPSQGGAVEDDAAQAIAAKDNMPEPETKRGAAKELDEPPPV